MTGNAEGPGAEGVTTTGAGGPLLRTFLMLGSVLFAALILHLGRDLLAPAATAVFVWFVLNAMADATRGLPGIGARLPRWASFALPLALLLMLAWFAVDATVAMRASIGAGAGGFGVAFDPLVVWIADLVGTEQAAVLDAISGRLGLETLLVRIAAGAAELVSTSGVVLIYVALLLADQAFFGDKLDIVLRHPERRAAVRALLKRVGGGIRRYMFVLSIASLMTAAASYGVMRLVGLDNAGFWAVVIFLLNFIPTIGSILGTIVPTLIALLQFQALEPAFVVLLGVGAFQVVIGNLLLPRMSGDVLNISLFVTIFALFVWGALWGATGMFLGIPMTAALIIVLAEFEATRPAAVLLSRTGDVVRPGADAG